MKIRSILLVLTALILIISVILLSGCEMIEYLMSRSLGGPPKEGEDATWEKEIDEAIEAASIEYWKEYAEKLGKKIAEKLKKQEEIIEKEQATAVVELEEGFEEEEKYLPNEPVTYSCEQGGISISIVINFKTTEVKGEIVSLSSTNEKVLYAEIDGTINIEDFFVKGTFNGFNSEDEYSGTITGVVTENLDTFIGAREWNRDHNSIDITATRK